MDIPKLYKYRYFNETLVSKNGLPNSEQIPQWQQVLYDGLIFPASPETFNDPYDCDLVLSDDFLNSRTAREILADALAQRCLITKSERDELFNTDNVEKTLKSILFHHFRARSRGLAQRMLNDFYVVLKQARDSLRVACFSETNRSILMWSHYAHNHQGFCIEYDFNHLEYKRHLKPVRYVNERHYVPGDFADHVSSKAGNAIYEAALYKSAEWCYEKEWRLVMSRIDLAHPEYRGLIPAMAVKEFITAVYLGVKASKNFEKAICTHYKETPIKIYRMKLSASNYSLQAEQIQ